MEEQTKRKRRTKAEMEADRSECLVELLEETPKPEKKAVQEEVTFLGTGSVWDNRRKKILCTFPRQIPPRDNRGYTILGELVVKDPETIKVLDDMGYKRK